MLDLALLTSPTGTRLDAPTPQATGVTASWNLQGCEALTAELPITLTNAFHLVDTPGTQHGQLNDGPVEVWSGRLENPTLTDEGTTLEALGYSRALTDLPYTALWSTTDISEWRPVLVTELASRTSEQWRFSTQGYLELAPQKGETMAATRVGSLTYETPDTQTGQGGRQMIGVQFRYEFLAPVNWNCDLSTFTRAFGGVATIFGDVGTGVLKTGALNLTFTAVDRLIFSMYYNAAAAVYGGETGAAYFRIYDLRITTVNTNRISTTLTVNRAAGVNVTATVGSTARMYVGQRLVINSPNAVSEIVTVLSIGGATTFNATFVQNYVIGNAVQALVTYADEVVGALATFVNGVNSTQLSSSTALIQSPGRDLPDMLWLDQTGDTILADLVQRGDTQTSPRRWVWSVEAGRLLRFAPLGDGGRTWYVDAAGITVQLSRENLFNDAYAVYESVSGDTVRTAVNPNTYSVARYGLTRRQMVSVSGSNALQAAAARDTVITQGAYPPPKVQVSFNAVFDGSGARWPLYLIRPGDTLFIRNLPPTLSTTVDQIRSFIVGRVEYHLDDDTVTTEPLDPLPTLEAALAG